MVDIRITGVTDTPEDQAARQLKQVFEKEISNDQDGMIQIIPNVLCFGFEVKDIDLMVIAQFGSGFVRNIRSKGKRAGRDELEDYAYRKVFISNFCFCVEVKDHRPTEVKFKGSRALVKYKGKWHDATNQNERQKYTLKAFLEENLGWEPFICNFIWFRNIPHDALPDIPHNWLSSDLSLYWILERAFDQKIPSFRQRGSNEYYSFACSERLEGEAFDEFNKVATFFSEAENKVGKITRDKLEKIIKSAILKD